MTNDDKQAIAYYRKGIESGDMKSATPLIVKHLLDIIDDLQKKMGYTLICKKCGSPLVYRDYVCKDCREDTCF